MKPSKFFLRLVSQCFLAISSILLLASCDVYQPENTVAPNEAPILADCFTYFHLTAWEDTNQDGLWDEKEIPLEGVEFFIDGDYANSIKYGKATSDSDGRATIDTWSPGECRDNLVFTIRVEPPQGYALTTEAPLHLNLTSQTSTEYQFGLYRLEGDS
ncbi:MAG: prealbumin-like fold domain-containing protein [Chloroflexota bacterium]